MNGKCSSLILVLLVFCFAGCRTKPLPPRPSDTVGTGPPSERVDWLNATQLYGVDAPELRDRELRAGMVNVTKAPISTIYFAYMDSVIRVGERGKLQEIAEELVAEPNQRILIEGHCDWRGTSEYNLGLGDRRANSVRNFLLTLGVSGDQLETNSKGDLESVVEGTEVEMALDRRADLLPMP